MTKIKLIVVILILFSTLLNAQNVTTISDQFLEDGMAIDAEGNLYVSHFSGDKVFKISLEGEVTPFISGLNTPNGLAFDNDGNLFVCDWQANKIYKYDSTGNLLNTYPTLGNPSGIIKAFDGNGLIFTHYSSNKLSRLASDGTINPYSSASLLNGPVGLAYDENGALFVGNYNNRRIYKVHENDSLEYIAQPPGTGALPNLGFLTYGNGKLYGTILSSHKIYEINPNTTDDFTIFAGTNQGNTDGDFSIAKFNQPNGLIFNASENVLYIAEFGSKNLRIISGILSTATELNTPEITVNIIPNPAGDMLKINASLSKNAVYLLEIYTINGQKIADMKDTSTGNNIEKTIDISQWSKGTYFIQLTIEGHIVTREIIKM